MKFALNRVMCFHDGASSMPVPSFISRLLAAARPRFVGLVLAMIGGAAVACVGAEPWSATRYLVRNWRVDDGLPHNTVNRIVQDGRGFLWLATAGGLARFDGLKFDECRVPHTTLDSTVNIRDLALEDEHTLLMLPANGGIMRFRDGAFTEHPASASFRGRQLLSLFVDRDHALWLVPSGSELVRWQGGVATTFGDAAGFNRRRHRVSFAVDGKGRTSIAAADFLGWYEQGALHRYAGDFGASVTVAPARSGGLWIATPTALLKIEDGAVHQAFAGADWSNQVVGLQDLFENADGSVWIASRRFGVFRLADGAMRAVPTSHDQVVALTNDAEGNVWTATSGGGIDRLRPQPFTRFEGAAALPDKIASSVSEDRDGTLWLADRRGGLVGIGPAGRRVLKPRDVVGEFFANVATPASDGSLWVGAEQGVFRLSPADVALEPMQPPLRNIHVLFAARNGDVWVGAGESGFGVFRAGTYRAMTSNDGYTGHRVKVVAEDGQGAIYVATDDRQVFEVVDGHLVPRITAQQMPGGLIHAAMFDTDDCLWLATSHGVVLRRNGRLHLFTSADGLPDDLVSQVLPDGVGRLWFGSRRGIFAVKRADLLAVAEGRLERVDAVALGRDDGLVGASALNNTQPMTWAGHDGRLWFTTFEGPIGIDPAASIPHLPAPRVYIDRILVNQVPVAAAHGVRLQPGDRQLEIGFAALNYASPDGVRLRHRLIGYDLDWVDTSRDRRATYGRLPPGDYVLQVTAANAGGEWNRAVASLTVTVIPRWWQTWWARGAFAAAFTLAVAGAARYLSVRRLRRKLERLEREHALEKERARIARNLHDELGGSLTQIGMLAERVRRQASDVTVKPVLGQLAWRTRRLSDELESIVWTVNPGNNTWDKLACFVDQYARSFCRDTPLTCSVTGVERIPGLPLAPEAQHNILSVTKEALNNVLKHARASHVDIELRRTDGTFEMRIRDDGVGFDPTAPEHAERNGLNNMRGRIAELHGCLEIHSRPGHGAEIVVRQPMSGQHAAVPTPA